MNRIFIVIIMLAAWACKKNVQPEQTTPPDLSLNLYNASEVLTATSTTERKYIFVDGSDTANTNQPFFYYYSGTALDEHPRDGIVQPGNVPGIPYMRLEAGEHRFVFTNAKKFKLADTTLSWQPGTYQQLYLVNDKPRADSSTTYRVLNVEEDRKRVEGKVRIRFINLSGDMDSLNVYRVDADGKRIFSGMPGNIRFATATSYADLDTAESVNQRLTLQFFKGTDTLGAVLSAAVPAVPGSSYVLLIQGFRSSPPNFNSIPFKNPVARDAAGKIIYENVQLMPNLRAVVRQSY